MEKNAGLSAPEAYLLLSLPRWNVHRALKLGFMGLVAQGVLRLEIEDRPGLIRTRHLPHLRVAPGVARSLPPVAASLVKVVRRAEPDGRVKDVLAHCGQQYRRTLVGFIQDCLGPALVARGLAEPRRRRILGLLPYDSFALTVAGEAEKARLQGLIRDAHDIPNYLDRDPAKAAALVAALGAAVLLVDELRPHYAVLERAIRAPDVSPSLPMIETDGFASGHDAGLCDFGFIDFSCFDSGTFDSFDAGFSDAGGDGGGGDGGASGGC